MENLKEIVFTNGKRKQKVFLSSIAAITALSALFSLIFLLQPKNMPDADTLPVLIIGFLAVSLFWGSIVGFAFVIKMGKVKVVVNDECVEYINGKYHRYYALIDFVESQMYTLPEGNGKVSIRSLVFSGSGNILYIHKSEFTDTQFQQISEAVKVRAQRLAEC